MIFYDPSRISDASPTYQKAHLTLLILRRRYSDVVAPSSQHDRWVTKLQTHYYMYSLCFFFILDIKFDEGGHTDLNGNFLFQTLQR